MFENAAIWAQYSLTAVYFMGGVVNLIGPKPVRDLFVAWGYPRWFSYVTGALELLTACLLLYPSTVMFGVVLGALIMIAALATLATNRAWNHSPGAILMLILTAVWFAAS